METFLEQLNQILLSVESVLPQFSLPPAAHFAMQLITVLLAVVIVLRCASSLLRGKVEEENWGFFSLPNGAKLPLSHWENIIGRASSCDVVLNFPTVSRQHAAVQRVEGGMWTIYPLGGRGGVSVNGKLVRDACPLNTGDKVTCGGIDLFFFPAGEEDLRRQAKSRKRPGRRIRPAPTLLALSAFQGLLLLQLLLAKGAEYGSTLILCFAALTISMWVLYAVYRAFRRTGFDLESIAFFLTSICLCVTASSAITTLPKQTFAALLGILGFVILGLFMRDLTLAKKLRWPVAIAACALLAFNVLFGEVLFGARNWVQLGPISFQPSEFVKIAFIIAGAETLDRLFARRNLIFTILFSLFCVGCLALMSDFGTALIFFIAFLAIAFLRSGDLPSVAMISAAAFAGCGVVLKFKPYIANRLAVWGHVWENSDKLGYQQTRTMSAAASGGLFGNGPDNGWLKHVGAANTDLVFGMVSEELGMIVAVLTVVCIITFSLFTFKAATTARSTFYVIAACSTSTMLVFQTILNVMGSLDLMPLTGVTFPFVSCGGSSIISCWTLLALIKAVDNRQNSGLAVRLPSRKDAPVECRPRRPRETGEDFDFDPSVFDDAARSVARSPQSIDDSFIPDPSLFEDDSRWNGDWDSDSGGIDVPLPEGPKRSSIDIPLGSEKGDRRR